MSKLLSYKGVINSFGISAEKKAFEIKLERIQAGLRENELGVLSNEVLAINETISTLHSTMLDLDTRIGDIKETMRKHYEGQAVLPIQESHERYLIKQQQNQLSDIENARKQDIFSSDDDAYERVTALIRERASWQYPSVYIRPNNFRFFNVLKASDMLYVMEECDIIKHLKKELSEAEYQFTRFNQINELSGRFIADQLPKSQIGLIVMEDFLNYKSIPIIQQYLAEAIEVLSPGGSLIFTFNDCDILAAVKNVTHGAYAYTPGHVVHLLCKDAGFEYEYGKSTSNISYVCIKKPGTLTSLKGGKTLGAIIPK